MDKTDLGAYFSAIKGMSDVDDAKDLSLFTGTPESIDATRAAFDAHFAEAQDAETGDFLFTLVGVLDDPFVA